MTDGQVIEALGFNNASDQVKQRVIDSARETVEMRLMSLVSEMMDDNQSAEFQRITESGDNEAGWEYLKREVIKGDMTELYEATMKDYIDQFSIAKTA